jgi:peptide/nickel transport system substrate-binding protein
MHSPNRQKWNHWLPALVALSSLLIVACGTAAPTTPEPAADTATPPEPTATPLVAQPSEPTPTVAAGAPTATPAPTPTPGAAVSARDTVTLVTNTGPETLGAWSAGCSGNVPSLVCEDLASDPLTWIDSTSFEVVPLSGVERWEEIEPNRWRFYLRDGVTFHNGERWNAEAAKMGIDLQGDKATAGHATTSYGFHGPITGEVVDDLTVDVVCEVACPILPRTTMFLKFQAPGWWEQATEDVRVNTTVGFGPYKMVEWRRGIEVELERFEDYKPNDSFDSQAPSIQRVFQVWRGEALVRASMVAAGEADLAFVIGFENRERAPKALTGTNNEVYLLVPDTIWHPELKKKKVRQALAHGIDCPTIMDTLYDGLLECYGNVSQEGTVGINDQNSAPYEYDPEMAQRLLEEANYDPANEIIIHSRQGRVFRDVELWEAVIGYWSELGVNARLQILEPARAGEVRDAGCGNFGEDALRCAEFDPPGPIFASTHYYETATSNETLDLQRHLLQRTSCFDEGSRVCNNVPGWEEMIRDAIVTPLGPERTRKLEELGQIIHDEYWFLPMFQVVTAYGLSEDLEWTPRYDPRTRVNTMTFSQ